jgi:Flp pilus assembly protein CpaB
MVWRWGMGLWVMAVVLAGCGADAAASASGRVAADLPTLASLPSLTPSDTPTVTPSATATLTPSATPTLTATPPPSATPRPSLTPYPHRWVAIAARPLPIGATITEDAVQMVAIPYEVAPGDAYDDLADVVGKLARTHFFCGQAILTGLTVEAGRGLARETERIANLADCAGGALPSIRAPYTFREVVIATRDLAAGQVIPESGVRAGQWVADFTPSTAFDRVDAVAGARLRMDVYAGQVLVVDMVEGG